jgi:hypothetical protein
MSDNFYIVSMHKANPRQLLQLLFVACLTTLLTGCYAWDECKNCSPPELAISELRMHGVAITTDTYPFPETIETFVTTDSDYTLDVPMEYLDSYQLTLVFSPPLDKAESANPTNNEWDEHPYAYSFSEFFDGDYRKIKPLLPYNYSVAPTTDLTSEYAPIRIDNYPSELVLYGNHLLNAIAAFPKNATHIELWHRQQREDELTLVRRVALDNLYAWREYLKPMFEEVSQ